MSPQAARVQNTGDAGDDEEADEPQRDPGKSLTGKKLRTVTVAHRSFPYREEIEHPYEPDKVSIQDKVGMRGEQITVLPMDYDRGMRFGAFAREGQDVSQIGVSTEVPGDLSFSAKDATDTELINWIKDDNPTVQQVVDASEGDPETASRLLTAEAAATGNDPRKGVIAGLEAVVARSSE